jgi:hypothetical protein
VHQHRRLQRLALLLLRQLCGSQLSQFLIDQRQQSVRRFVVTFLDRRQESCNVAHCRIVVPRFAPCLGRNGSLQSWIKLQRWFQLKTTDVSSSRADLTEVGQTEAAKDFGKLLSVIHTDAF